MFGSRRDDDDKPSVDLTFQVTKFAVVNSDRVPRGLQSDLFAVRQNRTPPIAVSGTTRDGKAVVLYLTDFRPYFFVDCPPGLTNKDLGSLLTYLKDSTGTTIDGLRIEENVRTAAIGFRYEKERLLRIIMHVPGEVAKARRFWLVKNPRGFRWYDHQFGARVFEANVKFHMRCSADIGVCPYTWVTIKAGTYRIDTSDVCRRHCDYTAICNYRAVISHPTVGEFALHAPQCTLSVDIETPRKEPGFPTPDNDEIGEIAVLKYDGVNELNASQAVVLTTGTGNLKPELRLFEVRKYACEKDMLLGYCRLIRDLRPSNLITWNGDNFDNPFMFGRAEHNQIFDEFSMQGRSPMERVKLVENNFHSKGRGSLAGLNFQSDSSDSVDMLRYWTANFKEIEYRLNSVAEKHLGEKKDDLPHDQIWDHHHGTDEMQLKLWSYNYQDCVLPQRLNAKVAALLSMHEMCRVTGVQQVELITSGQQIKILSQFLRFEDDSGDKYRFPTFHREEDDKPKPWDLKAADGEEVDSRRAFEQSQFAPHEPKGIMHSKKAKAAKVGSEGATVLEPIKGFYKKPVTVLDFSSMYPNIIIQYNMCYTTLVQDHALQCPHGNDMLRGTEVITCGCVCETPLGHRFVTARVRRGVIPKILMRLLDWRIQAKGAMKAAAAANNKELYKIMDARQLALKISANSVYGFTGATVGMHPCLAISASVTAYGRTMIELVVKLLEAKYQGRICPDDKILSLVNFCLKVIYGDTDSVMTLSGCDNVEQAIAFGLHAAMFVNAIFTDLAILETERRAFLDEHLPGWPYTLQDAIVAHTDRIAPLLLKKHTSCNCILFEKVYFPYLLFNKKRYAGMFWTNAIKADKQSSSGIESSRRDNCLLVRNVQQQCLAILFGPSEDPEKAAFDYIQTELWKLVRGEVDLALLKLTRGLNKKPEEYKEQSRGNMPHLAVNEKRIERGQAPYQLGERVPFIWVHPDPLLWGHDSSKVKAVYRAEDYDYAVENNVRPDYSAYLRAFEKPTARTFDTISGEGFTNWALFRQLYIVVSTSDGALDKMDYFKPQEKLADDGAVMLPEPEVPTVKLVDYRKAVAEWKQRTGKKQTTLKAFFAPKPKVITPPPPAAAAATPSPPPFEFDPDWLPSLDSRPKRTLEEGSEPPAKVAAALVPSCICYADDDDEDSVPM